MFWLGLLMGYLSAGFVIGGIVGIAVRMQRRRDNVLPFPRGPRR